MRWNACVHRPDPGLYSHPKVFFFFFFFWGGGMESEPMFTPFEKIPTIGKKKNLLRGGSKPRRRIKQDSESNTLPTSSSSPKSSIQNKAFLFSSFDHSMLPHSPPPRINLSLRPAGAARASLPFASISKYVCKSGQPIVKGLTPEISYRPWPAKGAVDVGTRRTFAFGPSKCQSVIMINAYL